MVRQRTRMDRRRRIVAAGVGVIVVLALLGGFLGSRSDSSSGGTTTTAAVSTSSTTALPADGVAPVPPPPGAALTGATPCPAEDGSSPRTTSFASAPPMCIDTGYFHIATIATTLGDITVQLNPRRSPDTVNTFVVLARYRYYDGQPLVNVTTRASFAFGVQFAGGAAAPGFVIPGEVPSTGTVFTPGALSMAPASTSDGRGGRLVFATFDQAPGNDQDVTPLGIMLSGDDTLAAIDALASRTGTPTATASITSITVRRGGAIA